MMRSDENRTLLLGTLLATLLTSLACSSVDVSSVESGQHSALEARLDEIIAAAMEGGPPAVSVGVAMGGDIVIAKGYGLADVENSVVATADTVYRIGSITKQFTAAAIMQLVDRDELEPTDELSEVLPDMIPGPTVTIDQLLNHTSGIKSYTGLGEAWRETVPLNLSHEKLIGMVRDLPRDFAPGAQWRYNNTGYYLLGMIIEEISGQTYAEYLDEHLYEPADLVATTYCYNRPIIPNRAEGYSRDDGELFNDEPIGMNQPGAAGALCSNVRDLVEWTQALAGGAVVSADAYAAMSTPGTTTDGEPLSYGYGLRVSDFEGYRKVSHGGGINGFSTYLSHYPDEDLVIAVLTNSDSGSNPGNIEQHIARSALGIP